MSRGLTSFILSNSTWLGAGALLTLMSSFGQTFFISVFAEDIQTEFGLSHGDWGLIYALGTTLSAIVMVWAGVAADRFRARSLGVFVLLGLAGACAFMALNTSALLLPVVIFLLRFTGQGMSHHLAVVTMARWFVATRGRALAIAALGFSFGEMILPVSFVFLMTSMDWRSLWGVAVLIVLVAIPILRRLLREERTPATLAQAEERAGMEGRHWTRQEALRHPLFWCILPAIMGLSAFGTAFLFQQLHYATTIGIGHLSFVTFFPIYTLVSVASMIGFGIALDRFGTARLLPFYQLPITLSFLLFASAGSVLPVAAGFVLFGLTAGGNATLTNAFWAEFYGSAHIGAIKSAAAAAMVLGSALGPALTGYLIDANVPITTQYVWISGYFILSSVGIWWGLRISQAKLSASV